MPEINTTAAQPQQHHNLQQIGNLQLETEAPNGMALRFVTRVSLDVSEVLQAVDIF
ncbi:hypothetical protein SH661x_001174 [Planctomicrobium sp. SH661]|uniref:hypothetical protein n=1 Tax=Planctomicrobium sp. SH661 TaxID=3448124 RepID=UPI003F5B79E2